MNIIIIIISITSTIAIINSNDNNNNDNNDNSVLQYTSSMTPNLGIYGGQHVEKTPVHKTARAETASNA